MKLTKIFFLAMCAMLCVSYTASAEEDDIISEANAPTIADPVNPQLGMVFRGYNIEYQGNEKFESLATTLANAAPVKSTVVSTETFSYENFLKDTAIRQGVWEGFLKCKISAKCTIVMKQEDSTYGGFLLFVNGKKVLCNSEQGSVDVDVKAGFNHIKVVSQTSNPVTILFSAKDSTKEPKKLSPAMMYHDEKPEEDII